MFKTKNIVEKNYIQEIDCLRAIAVILVVFFHYEIFNFSGGFLGVDIFFVLSGYLITKILSETKKEKYWLINFYNKRLRRILPALLIVIILSIIFSFYQFTPFHLERFANSIIASTLGISNFFFWQESGYFDYSKLNKPLLHTWSLSVELQLYLIWAIFFNFFILKLKKYEILIISLIISFSLIFSIIYSGRSPGFFYFTGFRLYEFAFGSLAFIIRQKYSLKFLGDLSFLIFLIIILLSTQIINETYDYNSFYSLIVVIASFFILLSLKNIHIFKFITKNQLLTSLGRVSYSLYLIHWPILIFYQYSLGTNLDHLNKLILILISIILSFLSYRYIEIVFRKKIGNSFILNNKNFSIFLIISLFSIILISLNLTNLQNKYKKISNEQLNILQQIKIDENDRTLMAKINEKNLENKKYGNLNKQNVLVIGDSHAFDIFWSIYLNKDIKKKINILYVGKGWDTCFGKIISENFLTKYIKKFFNRYDQSKVCEKFVNDNFLIEKMKKSDFIILANRWQIDTRFREITNFVQSNSSANIIYFNNIDRFEHVPTLYFKHGVKINDFSFNKRDPVNNRVNNRMREILENNDIKLIDRSNFFCGNNKCLLLDKNNLLFTDEDHVSKYGAIYMGQLIKKLRLFNYE